MILIPNSILSFGFFISNFLNRSAKTLDVVPSSIKGTSLSFLYFFAKAAGLVA